MNESLSSAKTLSEHLSELRGRFFWIIVSVIFGSTLGYFLNSTLLVVLIEPLKQPLYYTSPTGGFELVIKISVIFGIIVSAPVITYHVFRFLEPAMPKQSKKVLLWFLGGSWALMIIGLSFAYFLSLPAALHFLGEFGTKNVQSLISTNEYFSFILRYLAGFAILFQLPLILLMINQMNKLKPKKLISLSRFVIIASFVIAAIITPTPDPVNQTIMAVPLIALYFFSVFVIWILNREEKVPKTSQRSRIKQRKTFIASKSSASHVNAPEEKISQHLHKPRFEKIKL